MENNGQDIKDKVDELNQLAWDTRVNDSPGSFKLSKDSLELLKEVDYPKGKAEALKCMASSSCDSFNKYKEDKG